MSTAPALHLDHTHGLKLGPKIGPLPAGVWVLVVGGGLYVGYRRKQASAGASATDTTATDPAATQSSADPSAGGYGLSGTGTPIEGGDSGSVMDGTGDPSSPPAPAAPVVIVLPGLTPAGTTPTPAPSRTTVLVSDPKRGPAPAAKPAPAPAKKAPARTPTRTAPKPAAQTYTVRSGDTLSAIAAAHHTTVSALYGANSATIEAAAKGHGKSSSGGGHWIYPGTVLRLP